MSNIELKRYVRNPLVVDAIQVTEDNFLRVAMWCGGRICDKQTGKPSDGPIDPKHQYISVRVHKPMNDRQAQAHLGDHILQTTRGYKIYTDRAFKSSFQEERRDITTHIAKDARERKRSRAVEKTLENGAKEALDEFKEDPGKFITKDLQEELARVDHEMIAGTPEERNAERARRDKAGLQREHGIADESRDPNELDAELAAENEGMLPHYSGPAHQKHSNTEAW